MAHFADELVPLLRCEAHTLGQVELPSLLEGQVSLLGIRDLHPILHELDADVWRVEATHMTDQSVWCPIFARVVAIHLNLWWS